MNNMPAPLLPGVTVTNEPGLYKAGRFGIRIENTMLVVPSLSTEFGDYCAMEPLTICPISKEPIIPELLGNEAIAYLNQYHGWVYEKLSGFFCGEELEFLKEACAAL
jgi:Xaa-Pro aminopeptidase